MQLLSVSLCTPWFESSSGVYLAFGICGKLKRTMKTVCLPEVLLPNFFAVLSLCGLAHGAFAEESERVSYGVCAIYDFSEGQGELIYDKSGFGMSLDLKISDPAVVAWREGALDVVSNTRIAAQIYPSKIIESVRQSGEITIEAWVRPAAVDQEGPARIVTLSANGSLRNFTLGQDGNKYDVRFRSRETTVNGIPSLASKNESVTTELTHIVYTRGSDGKTRTYINGALSSEGKAGGDIDNWDRRYQFGIANEHSDNRPWLGTYYLVAVYNRSLADREVLQNFEAGHDVVLENTPENPFGTPAEQHFATKIAPLLAERCLECHDAHTQKAKLDLSNRDSAFAGGRSGEVIIPGDAENSPLWHSIADGEMPKDRDPLSEEEARMIRTWIDNGAAWGVETIDPADYQYRDVAGENWIRRLTLDEYIASVKSATGVDISNEARDLIPRDLRADGFRNTAYNLHVDLDHVSAYARLASIVAEKVDVSRFTPEGALTNEDLPKFIRRAGRELLRGPVNDEERNAYGRIAKVIAEAGGDATESARYILEAMLQSPRFLYRIETEIGDGSRWPVGPNELASRLAFALWGAPPDDALWESAQSGVILDPEESARQVERMLNDPRAIDHSVVFISDWLNLDRLKSLRPNAEKFPQWDSTLADDMRAETIDYFKEIVWNQQRPMSDLLNAQVTFASPRLAEFYGLSINEDGATRYDLTGVPERGGLLTQGSILTIGGDEASMVTRGLFVLHDLLRGSVKNPPPDVDTTPIPSSPGLSKRTVAEGRVSSEQCGACHRKFEPLAYGLERFDGLGAYHIVDEYGNEQEEHGEILVPGVPEAIAYNTTAELMDALAASPRVQSSLTWKLTQFVLGRPLAAEDRPYVDAIHESAQAKGGTYQATMAAIAASDLMRTIRTEPYE